MRVMIVSGSDSVFWPIAKGCVDSLGRAADHDSKLFLGFLDDGLEPEQIEYLTSKRFTVEPTRWCLGIPESFQKGFPGSRVKVSKTMLPDIFPGFDVYIWVDADAWLQEESAISELVQGAMTNEVSLVSQRNPKYSVMQYVNLWRVSVAKQYFGYGAALNVLFKPYFNSGVFAMQSSSRVWSAWQSAWRSAIAKRKQYRVSDQAALNHVITTQKVKIARFDATYNWACHLAQPYWDSQSSKWRTSENGELIKVLHMTHTTKSDATLHY
jgi:hypothetical protein